MIERQAETEHGLRCRTLPKIPSQFADVIEVDVLLEHDEAVELHHADFSRNELEATLEDWIAEDTLLQRLKRPGYESNGRVVRPAALALFEFADVVVCDPPLGG